MNDLVLKQIFSAQIGLLQRAVEIIDAAEPVSPATPAPVNAPEEVIDPIYVGLRFQYSNMDLTVVDIADDTILCESIVRVISNGFENIQKRDVRLSRSSVLNVLSPYVGQLFMDGDTQVEVQHIADDKVYGLQDDGAAYIENTEVVRVLLQ